MEKIFVLVFLMGFVSPGCQKEKGSKMVKENSPPGGKATTGQERVVLSINMSSNQYTLYSSALLKFSPRDALHSSSGYGGGKPFARKITKEQFDSIKAMAEACMKTPPQKLYSGNMTSVRLSYGSLSGSFARSKEITALVDRIQTIISTHCPDCLKEQHYSKNP